MSTPTTAELAAVFAGAADLIDAHGWGLDWGRHCASTAVASKCGLPFQHYSGDPEHHRRKSRYWAALSRLTRDAPELEAPPPGWDATLTGPWETADQVCKVIAWNDAPGRTAAEVTGLLRRFAARLTAEAQAEARR